MPAEQDPLSAPQSAAVSPVVPANHLDSRRKPIADLICLVVADLYNAVELHLSLWYRWVAGCLGR